MEELVKFASIIPAAVLILAVSMAVAILSINLLFVFSKFCSCLALKARKIIAKRFED
ncbi:MAG: hypothetical protein IKI76_11090 [Selenomonadaceae bacterium]|nr:hypothetical protein [Selenomonadaceae bacterium]